MMGDLYRHIDPGLSTQQAANFVTVARHLILSTRAPDWRPELFHMFRIAWDTAEGEHLEPADVTPGRPNMQVSLLGYAPLAGLAAEPGEDWDSYQLRVFGAHFSSPLSGWLFDSYWWHTDDTPLGAAMRLMYVLDYGVPHDWQQIEYGQAESDYLDNSFLWERVGLWPEEN